MGFSGAQVVGVWARRAGREGGGRRAENPSEGPRGRRGQQGPAHTRSPARTGHSALRARDTPPAPPGREAAHGPGALRGSGRARSHSLARATLRSPTAPSPGQRLPRGGSGSAAATSPPSGCRGREGALTAAGAPRARARRGQHEAAAAACGLFPPFINPAQGPEAGRGRAESRDRAGGGCPGPGGGRKTSAPAGASLGSCVRCERRGPRWGRGGLRRGVLSCADPGGQGCFGERGSGHRRRSLPGGGRAAKDTCRLPGLRRA